MINLKKPNNSISTGRVLKSILPEEFKIISDKNSNGYKYLNLLYGTEFDTANRIIKNIYKNSFLDSFDLTKNYSLYETNLSGIPNTNYLNSSGIQIKITDEFEFYNGPPTRLNFSGNILLPMQNYYSGIIPSGNEFLNNFDIGFNTSGITSITSITGLEYLRRDSRGSGYLVISSDIDQETAYHSGLYPTFTLDVGSNFKTSGDIASTYGCFTGIKTQSYSGNLTNEILRPIDSKTLSGKYPLYRTIIDSSGYSHTIDHYEPYKGWVKNAFGTVVAYLDYSGEFYYNDHGEKIYYRTAKNNPYGYNNYDVAYLDLRFAPISGTLKVYDIDILDISGNAIEIPSSGKSLYYYKSPKMLYENSSTDGVFDPIYIGYDSTVPSGYGFSSNMEGSGCSLYKTTSWDYLHESGYFDNESLQYIDGSGTITNKIKISGYHSRYMVEYDYKIYDNLNYISSLNNNGQVSTYTQSPLVTVDNNNYNEINYKFTKDSSYGNEQSKIITFDGIDIRPNSKVDKINFNIPYLLNNGELNYLNINTNKRYIGYSNDFVPQNTDKRYYALNCYFDSNITGSIIESDLSSTGNNLTYSGLNSIYKINFDNYFGKKIINTNLESYYYVSNTFLSYNTFFWFEFKTRNSSNYRLMELYDNSLSKYVYLHIDSNGYVLIYSDNFVYRSNNKIKFNNNIKYLILNYNPDEINSNYSFFNLYYKEGNELGYKNIKLFKSSYTAPTVDSTIVRFFINSTIDVGNVKIFYEDL